ncbi:MAG: hypothetical protein NUV74_09835 [Candidatus Brocadiaceae bacterium]|nr:hypothetical protein [Candidatus Brocadiaceae bacterium]
MALKVWRPIDPDVVEKYSLADKAKKVGDQLVDLTRENFITFCEELNEVLGSVKTAVSGYQLDEIEVAATVEATGKIVLVGEAKVGACITLKFKKS